MMIFQHLLSSLILIWSYAAINTIVVHCYVSSRIIHPLRLNQKYSSSTLLHSSTPKADAKANGPPRNAADARAGTAGYSVLRQPVNWDAEEDPEFDAPRSLREEDETSMAQEDSLWWNDNIKGLAFQKEKEDESKTNANKGRLPRSTTDNAIAEDEELDLYQRSLDTLDFPKVLQALMRECSTAPGRSIVQDASHFHNLPLATKQKKIPQEYQSSYIPLIAETVEGVQERYRAVQEMEWLLNNGNRDQMLDEYSYRNRKGYKEALGGRGPPLKGMSFNLQAVLQIADEGKVLEGPEILEVSSIMDSLEDLQLWSQALQKVNGLSFEELPKLVDGIFVNTTLQDLLYNAFDKKGRLSGDTFPELGALREKVRTLKADIMQTLDGLLAMPSIQSKLALESGGSLYSEVNGGRLVIPIASKYASSVGIVHDKSRSEKTVYVEPTEIVGPTNELRQAESELRQEEARVWRSLTEQVLNNRVELEASVNAVGQIDLVTARLMLGQKLNGIIPLVKDEGVVSLRDAKHPVLLLREIENVVGSDIDLGADGNQGLVLTGPNSGGKTVILKLLGLIALMSRGGIPVPASQTVSVSASGGDDDYVPRVDFFDPVLADIGDLQSVGGDLSTFSGHMLVCREVLSNSGKNALVLMDELGSGTDPNQGVAIAQAIMEALLETGARCCITTHYMQLKQLAASDDRFAVAGMQFVNGRPTYKLLPGTVGESFALAVAERLELPPKVIERANELLDSETRQMGDLIRDLEDQRAIVDQQVQELEDKKKEMAAMELKIKEEQIRLEKKQLTARRDEAKKFAKKLEEKERLLEDILDKLKQDPSRRILAKSWDDIKFVKRDALTEAENVPSVLAKKQKVAGALEDAKAELVPLAEMREKPDLQAGDKLIVCQGGTLFGREATVVNMQRNRATVNVAGVSMSFKLQHVALPPGKGSSFVPTKAAKTGSGGRGSSNSKAVERALEAERSGPRDAPAPITGGGDKSTMRTQSNTVDVRGCNLMEAQDQAKAKFSAALMGGRSVVYILHGHGTGGVLKTKIRNWLKTERQLVKKFQPAAQEDGGDAFTRVELK